MNKNNLYAIILAGGKGTRMGNIEKPKQFMEIGNKPIIIHTIEKFVLHTEFDEILVLSPKQWIKHTEDLIRKYISSDSRIHVIEGGATRNETIMNAIQYIDREGNLNDETVIVTHDSVRPFLTHRIIDENIRYAREFGACNTVIPATDTIVESKDHQFVTSIPDRATMYQGQTPQTFKAVQLRDLYESLTAEEKEILTDACKILIMKGEKVHLVEGEVSNIKITYPHDLRVAEALLGGE